MIIYNVSKSRLENFEKVCDWQAKGSKYICILIKRT